MKDIEMQLEPRPRLSLEKKIRLLARRYRAAEKRRARKARKQAERARSAAGSWRHD
jgi:hypothetical protein